jgi:NTP pyrophosphatase (non-canonical NTP hydrolase)
MKTETLGRMLVDISNELGVKLTDEKVYKIHNIIFDNDDLSFAEYEEIIDLTAIYPNKGNNLTYPVLGLCGETGEVAEKVKKIIRDSDGVMSDEVRLLLIKEVGDVLWYATALSHELGTTLEEVAQTNYQKLIDRLNRNKIKGSGDNR